MHQNLHLSTGLQNKHKIPSFLRQKRGKGGLTNILEGHYEVLLSSLLRYFLLEKGRENMQKKKKKKKSYFNFLEGISQKHWQKTTWNNSPTEVNGVSETSQVTEVWWMSSRLLITGLRGKQWKTLKIFWLGLITLPSKYSSQRKPDLSSPCRSSVLCSSNPLRSGMLLWVTPQSWEMLTDYYLLLSEIWILKGTWFMLRFSKVN